MARLGNWKRRFRKVDTQGGKVGRQEYAIREDGSVVEQLTVDGHAYGWKVFMNNKLKPAGREKLMASLLEHGFEEVTR